MKPTCPHNEKISYPESLRDQTQHMSHGIVKLNHGLLEQIYDLNIYTEKEQRYIQYALLIQDFVIKNNDWIDNILVNCYRKDMTQHEYIDAIYSTFRAKFSYLYKESYNPDYERLEHGIGTALLILKSLIHNSPEMSYVDCIKYCENIMKYVHIHELPIHYNDKEKSYNEYIKNYISNPAVEEANRSSKLFCPLKYTPEGNSLFKKIIIAFYGHFPV